MKKVDFDKLIEKLKADELEEETRRLEKRKIITLCNNQRAKITALYKRMEKSEKITDPHDKSFIESRTSQLQDGYPLSRFHKDILNKLWRKYKK